MTTRHLYGSTPLYLAAHKGFVGTVNIFIENKDKVDANPETRVSILSIMHP